MEENIEILSEAIRNYDSDAARKVAKEAVDKGVDLIKVLNEGAMKAMDELSEKFSREEIFLPELMLAAEAFFAAYNVLRPKIIEQKPKEVKPIAKVVIGTVAGDIHDIGKFVVATLLEIAGFEVHDIGKDVPAEKFVEKAKEVRADIVGASALITYTMLQQKSIIEALTKAGIRKKVITLIGGAPTSREWADEIGADGVAKSAPEAVKLAKNLVKMGGREKW